MNINRKYDAFLVIFSPKDKLPSSYDHIAHDACEIVIILFGTVNYSRGGGGGETGTILRWGMEKGEDARIVVYG